jgi:hypothetical protein
MDIIDYWTSILLQRGSAEEKGSFELIYTVTSGVLTLLEIGSLSKCRTGNAVCMSLFLKLFRALIVFCSFWASFMVHITLLIHVSCVHNILLYIYIYTAVCLDVSVYIYIHVYRQISVFYEFILKPVGVTALSERKHY